ncbi:hypothetical protein C5Y96_05905 [Blastopirellula marina]|uniref:Uncharacterized protein n=1 Tax=Blastopirellula marina TaxID=124 RepID=A0A2S8G4M9_9BACT|nr:hypothetical protein C5Y96_05905 [Blastopirellula marina]RCS55695.1 hypothetical protein DTL36_05915 [Bremerella cremea]
MFQFWSSVTDRIPTERVDVDPEYPTISLRSEVAQAAFNHSDTNFQKTQPILTWVPEIRWRMVVVHWGGVNVIRRKKQVAERKKA